MVDKIRFAIIGCGRIGQRHAEHINKLGVLVAVCDVEKQKAEQVANNFGGNIYSDIDELLRKEQENIDVISICTPNGLHAHHSITSLSAGFNVLCEKPMATTILDCQKMIAVADSNDKQLFAIKQNRFNPPVMAVKKALDENRLGKIFSIQLNCFWNRNADYYHNSWKGTKDMDGGTLFTQFSHFIDLLYWMFGDVKDVFAKGKNFAHQGIIEFEDTGVVCLEFLSGSLGTIHYTVNASGKNMEGSLTIFGEKGTVKIGGQYLNELEYQSIEGYIIENLPPGNLPNNYGNYIGSMSNHDKVYENVIDVLQNNGAITTSAFEGLKTVEIIEKIYLSMKENG
jgi:UDP-N-acetyl-2-amino-2-deoxyglucuronate dehydrogenase